MGSCCWKTWAYLGLLIVSPAWAAEPAIRIVNDQAGRPVAVEAIGLPRDQAADETAWPTILAIYVAGEAAGVDPPAMLGSYAIAGETLRFTPRYPLQAGLKYRIVLRPTGGAAITQEISLPAAERTAPTKIIAAYPSADTLPENQLRFYLHFSAPMRRGDIYQYIKLLKDDGEAVDLPFLEIGEELWDATGKRLTLLIDPGRIKRGLKPREESGPVLEAGKRYTLVVDPAWLDAAGKPLAAKFEKKFTAGPPVETAIETKDWKLTLPSAGTTDPVVAKFPRPLDHALLERTLTVEDRTGAPVEGEVKIGDAERRWEFTPAKPWKEGKYDLVAETTLEDVAGNRIGRPFEVDVFQQVDRKVESKKVWTPFALTRASRPDEFRPRKPTPAQPADKPNVVIILSDDQAWTDYGFQGHPHIQTPSLDKLAAQSVVFTRGYVPTSLCRPSLMTLITGLYAHQHLVTGNDPPKGTDRSEMLRHVRRLPTLPKLLAERGYVSFQTGKWWEGTPAEGGFTAGMSHGDPSRGGRHGDLGLKIGREGLQPIYDFLEANRGQPFFLWYAPMLPHTPHTPPERLLEKYRAKTDSLHVAKYWAMCEWWDETCGELLSHLDKRGLAEDTIVVYLADNGWIQDPAANKFAPRSKRSPYEGGIRQPIMIRWPARLKPLRDERTLVSSIDLAPTILAACGIHPTKEMRGLNLLDVATGKQSGHAAVFGEIYAHDAVDLDRPEPGLEHRWCVAGDWKLIESADGKSRELYNMTTDPHEKQDLAAEKSSLVDELSAKIKAAW